MDLVTEMGEVGSAQSDVTAEVGRIYVDRICSDATCVPIASDVIPSDVWASLASDITEVEQDLPIVERVHIFLRALRNFLARLKWTS